MIIKKLLIVSFLIYACLASYADIIDDTNIFKFDRRVDNKYLSQYTKGYTEFFRDIVAIDAVREKSTGLVFGCVVEKSTRVVYCLDESPKIRTFGYNTDTKKLFLNDIGRMAVTSSGRIYVIDNYKRSIFWWNRNAGTYFPEGTVERGFPYMPLDICKDKDDNLYMIDGYALLLMKYSTREKKWIPFSATKKYIDLKEYYNKEWSSPCCIEANPNGIYVAFYGGAIVRYTYTGDFMNYYWIDEGNLGLFSSCVEGISETWLKGITSDVNGHIYVLDTHARKVHIFTRELEYISSWHDPGMVMDATATDIAFATGEDHFFITYPWGFDVYRLNKKSVSVNIDRSFIYPELVGGDYNGINLELKAIGSGNLDIVLSKTGFETKIVDKHALANNESFSFTWNGKTPDGNNVPYGSYTMKFLMDGVLAKSVTINVKKAPEISLSGEDNVVFNSTMSEVEYTYQVTGDGYIKASVSPLSDYYESATAWEKIINEGNRSTGTYTQIISSAIGSEELGEGYYTANFYLLPIELKDLNIQAAKAGKLFIVDRLALDAGAIANKTAGFNPFNSAIDKMEASISLSEGAFGTLDILNESNGLVTNVFRHAYLAEGIKNILWNGYSEAGALIDDGNYKFSMTIEQDFIGTSLLREGDAFALDKTPPRIAYSSGQTLYYISPDEPSSIGAKDDCAIGFSFNENASASAAVFDKDGVNIKALRPSSLLGKGESAEIDWAGNDEAGSFVPDGKYIVKIFSSDDYGNASSYNMHVIVDNNRLSESSHEELFSSEEKIISPLVQPPNYDNIDPSISKINRINEGFVIVWEEEHESESVIYAQLLDENLEKLRSPISIDSGFVSHPTVARLESGFVVAWVRSSLSGATILWEDVYAQRFNDAGDKIGSAIKVNSVSSNWWQNSPFVIAVGSGFAVVWNANKQDANGYDIYKRIYNSTGIPAGPEVRINSNVSGHQMLPSVAKTANGYSVAWASGQTGNTVRAIRLDNNFNAVGGEIAVNESPSYYVLCYPSVASLGEGFAVSWDAQPSPGGSQDIYARIFGSAGNPLGHEFRVNTWTQSSQRDSAITNTHEGFVATWTSDGQDGSWFGVYAQRYDASGNPIGYEFCVNNYRQHIQYAPSVTESQNGFVVTWFSYYEAEAVTKIVAKKFESYVVPQGGNLAAEILSPDVDPYLASNNFSVTGIASDSNIDRYTLSLVSPTGTNIIENVEGTNVKGEISLFNILSCAKSTDYTLKLESWDKAANYREEHITLRRAEDSQSLIETFAIDKKYNSLSHPPRAAFKVAQSSNVSFRIINEYSIALRHFDLGAVAPDYREIDLDISGISDGDYFLAMYATSEALGSFETRLKLTIDNTPPAPSIASFGNYFSTQSGVAIPASVAEPHVKTVDLRLLDSAGATVRTIVSSASTSGLADASFDPLALSEGDYTLSLAATDLALNSASCTHSIHIDRSAPVISLSSPDFAAILHGNVHVSGTIADSAGVASYSASLARPGYGTILLYSGSGNAIDFAWQTQSGAFDGTLELQAIDRAGNPATLRKPLIVDNNPPEITLSFDSAPAAVGNRSFINAGNKLYLAGVSGDAYSIIEGIFYDVNSAGWIRYAAPINIPADGDYTILYYATDDTGNASAVGESSFTVDATPPSYVFTIADPKYDKDGNIYVPLSNNIRIDPTDGNGQFTSGVAGVMIQVDGGVWEEYSGAGIKIYNEGPHSIGVRVFDFAGNVFENTEGPVIVDIAPPSTNVSADTGLYYSLQRDIIALDAPGGISLSAIDFGLADYFSGVKRIDYVLDGILSEYTEPLRIEAGSEHSLHFYATDNVGNVEQRTPVIVAVDDTPPEASFIAENPVYSSEGVMYSNAGNTFGFSASDDFAGVKAIFYRPGSGDFVQFEENFVQNEEADLNIEYYALDFLDHDSGIKTQRLVIDTTPPVTAMTTNIPLVTINGAFYADSRYVFTWNCADEKSGVASTYVAIDGTPLPAGTLDYSFAENGVHVIVFYSVDNVGNTEAINTVYVTTPIPDTTAPVTAITPSYAAYNNGSMDFFKSDVTFTLSAIDSIGNYDSHASGVDTTYFTLDGGAETQYSGTAITVSGEGLHEIRFHSKDKAGNLEIERSYVFETDDTPPVSKMKASDPYLIIDGVIFVSTNGKIGIESQDASSGVKSIFYRIDSASDWSIYESAFSISAGRHTIEYFASDNLSNNENVKIVLINAVPGYNTISYKTASIEDKSKHITAYDVSSSKIAMLEGTGRASDIYIDEIEDKSHGFKDERKLTAKKEKRLEISIDGNAIATCEERDGRKDIYLYNTFERRQRGLRLSVTGENVQPLVIDNHVYWINEENGISSIVEYAIDSRAYKTIFTGDCSINITRTNDGKLSFTASRNLKDQIYKVANEEPELIFEKDISQESDRIIAHSIFGNILAIEELVDGKNLITILELGETFRSIGIVEGIMPVLIDNLTMIYIENKEDYEVLRYYNLVNGASTGIIKAREFVSVIPESGKNIFIERIDKAESNKYKAKSHRRWRFCWRGCSDRQDNSQFVYLKYVENEALVEGIEYSYDSKTPAYNRYFDEEDFLFADDLEIFEGKTRGEGHIHQIQTLKHSTTSQGNVLVRFTAKKNIRIYVISEEIHGRYKHDWKNQHSHIPLSGLFDDYDIKTFNVNEGETFVLNGNGPGEPSPVILVMRRFDKGD